MKFKSNVKRLQLAHLLRLYEEVSAADGTVLSWEGDLEVGKEIFTYNDNGEIVPANDGEYELNDSILVIQSGILTEIKEKSFIPDDLLTPSEEMPVEENMACGKKKKKTKMEDEIMTDGEQAVEEVVDLAAENEMLKQRIAELEALLAGCQATETPIIEEPAETILKRQEYSSAKNESLNRIKQNIRRR